MIFLGPQRSGDFCRYVPFAGVSLDAPTMNYFFHEKAIPVPTNNSVAGRIFLMPEILANVVRETLFSSYITTLCPDLVFQSRLRPQVRNQRPWRPSRGVTGTAGISFLPEKPAVRNPQERPVQLPCHGDQRH